MEDDGGQDEKIIAVPAESISRRYVTVRESADLPEITRYQIQHFFEHYKDLEPDKWVRIEGWGDSAAARQMIEQAVVRYQGNG